MSSLSQVTTCIANFTSLPLDLLNSTSVEVLNIQTSLCGFKSFSERLGTFFTVEGAFFSFFSVSFILLVAFIRWSKVLLSRFQDADLALRQSDASDSANFLNLMFADLIQSIGFFPNIRWVVQARVIPSTLCTAQGAIKQIGVVSVSLSALAIAIHTFMVLVLEWRDRGPVSLSTALVVAVWVITALIVGIPNAVHRNAPIDKPYYGNTGNWCWITDHYGFERIAAEYFWVWLTAALLIVIYGVMYLDMNGHITFFHKETDEARVEPEDRRRLKQIANSLLFYPLVFIVCILPNTISRWLQFGGTKPPHQFSLFANTVFALSGAFNLILFFLTRPRVVLGPESPPQEAYDMKGDVSSVEDMETGMHRRESTTSTAVSASHAKVTHRTSAGGVVLRKNQLPQRPGTHIEEDYEDEMVEDSDRPLDDIQRVTRKAPSS